MCFPHYIFCFAVSISIQEGSCYLRIWSSDIATLRNLINETCINYFSKEGLERMTPYLVGFLESSAVLLHISLCVTFWFVTYNFTLNGFFMFEKVYSKR